jgi:Tol biopolymer transport system component
VPDREDLAVVAVIRRVENSTVTIRCGLSPFRWNERGVDLEIFTIRADGGSSRRLTDNTSRDELPSYSPSGRRIVFTFQFEYYLNPQVYMMRTDGGGARQVTATPGWDASYSVRAGGSSIRVTTATTPRSSRSSRTGAKLEGDSPTTTSGTTPPHTPHRAGGSPSCRSTATPTCTR